MVGGNPGQSVVSSTLSISPPYYDPFSPEIHKMSDEPAWKVTIYQLDRECKQDTQLTPSCFSFSFGSDACRRSSRPPILPTLRPTPRPRHPPRRPSPRAQPPWPLKLGSWRSTLDERHRPPRTLLPPLLRRLTRRRPEQGKQGRPPSLVRPLLLLLHLRARPPLPLPLPLSRQVSLGPLRTQLPCLLPLLDRSPDPVRRLQPRHLHQHTLNHQQLQSSRPRALPSGSRTGWRRC